MPRAAVALGGNALTPDADASFEQQQSAVRTTVDHLSGLREAGYDLLCTHGNGPQVGHRLLEQEAAATPTVPLDVLVAETQAQLGAMLQRTLDGALAEEFLTLVTQVVVDPDDDAFENPTKPVGPAYTEREAREKEFETAPVGTGERRYRRVVPSPEPVAVVESEEIAGMVERGQGVICGGGGGVPVARGDDGLRGVEAVVDKDYTTQLLANACDADELAFLTDVAHVYLDYGTPDQRALTDPDPGELRAALEAKEFGEGSMRPKVEACLDFLDAGGDRAIVCLPEDLTAAMRGEAGTRIE